MIEEIYKIKCDICKFEEITNVTDWLEENKENYVPKGWTENGDGYFWSMNLTICPECTKELMKRCKPIYNKYKKEIKQKLGEDKT